MKKFLAMLLMGAVLVSGAFSVGCGDDKKPAAGKDSKPGAGKTDGEKKDK